MGQRQSDGELFAREGAKVLAADINLDAALETKRIIEAEGGVCEGVSGDVSRADDVAVIVDNCIAAFGRIDVLHNNVGIVEVGGPVETSEESWDRVNNVNLKSMFLTCKQVLPHMVRQGKGAIVNIASVSLSGIRWLGVPYISYATTKAGSSNSPGHRSPIRSVGHTRELDPAGDDEYADGARRRGHRRIRRQRGGGSCHPQVCSREWARCDDTVDRGSRA